MVLRRRWKVYNAK